MASVSLRVNGRDYAGWQTVRVTRGIESVSGSFELGVSERWANQDQPWPIAEGDACSVLLGGATVLTGYVDTKRASYGPGSHSVSLAGRDKAGDLVDCSANLGLGQIHPKWEFKNLSVLRFAQKICAPFGITVTLQPGLVLPPSPAKLSVDPGDSAFNALEHACRLAGVLPVSDGRGGLVLTRSGTGRCSTALVEGENIKSASAEFSHADRFHRYYVLAQHRGSDEFFGEQVATISGSAVDPNVRRTERVLLVRPEGNATAAHAQKRAQWEAATRAARADTVTVTVQGWAQASGELWPVNTLVRIKSPRLGVDGEMLITQATYALSLGSGSTTQLALKRPEAFLPEPVVRRSNVWKEIARGV